MSCKPLIQQTIASLQFYCCTSKQFSLEFCKVLTLHDGREEASFFVGKKNHRKDCLSFSSYSISCPSSLPLWSLLVLTDLPCYSANSASAFFLNFLRSSLILLHVAVEGGSGTMMASPGIVPESGRKLPIKKVNLKIPMTSHRESV